MRENIVASLLPRISRFGFISRAKEAQVIALVQSRGTIAMLAPVAAGFVVGLVNGVLSALARMVPFIVTLAALLGLKGFALARSPQP